MTEQVTTMFGFKVVRSSVPATTTVAAPVSTFKGEVGTEVRRIAVEMVAHTAVAVTLAAATGFVAGIVAGVGEVLARREEKSEKAQAAAAAQAAKDELLNELLAERAAMKAKAA